MTNFAPHTALKLIACGKLTLMKGSYSTVRLEGVLGGVVGTPSLVWGRFREQREQLEKVLKDKARIWP